MSGSRNGPASCWNRSLHLTWKTGRRCSNPSAVWERKCEPKAPPPPRRRPNFRNSPGNTNMNFSRRNFIGMTAGAAAVYAQDRQPIFRVKVDMVVLSFQVTDSKNRYINGLKPTDFRIYEDGILQKISTFQDGDKAPLAVSDDGSTRPLLEARNESLPGMERP